MLCLTIPLILFTAPWCKEKLVVLPSHSYTVWWFLSFGCRRCGLAGSGSLSCHRPMPDTQNSPCAFLALSPSVAFTPTRVTLQLSFWRPGCILYYFPLFLLTLPCRPLSDTSSLSVLLHCVLVEEDLWAGSRHPKKYSSLFSFFPFFFFFFTPSCSPCSWLRENMEHGCLFFQSLSPRPLPYLWVSSPFFFFHLLLLSFSPSALAVSMFFYGDCVARVHDKWSRPTALLLLLPVSRPLCSDQWQSLASLESTFYSQPCPPCL